MTSETLRPPTAVDPQINSDSIGEGLVSFERTMRPNEGWVAAILLLLNLIVVVISVERADWVPSPNLLLLMFLAMLTALALYRVPSRSVFLIPAGLAVGFAIILWQLSSFSIDGAPVSGASQVLERLELWLDAARSGSINIDRLPFSFALMTSTWLTGFLGAWLFLRFGNFWGVFVLGGIGLMSNLTFLPPDAAFHLAFYLFTALLLVARVQAIRRKHEWERRAIKVDDHLAGLTLSDSLGLTILVIVAAFLLPIAPKFGVVNDAYESMRSPLESVEDDFNRLFAGLPARRPIGFRIWGDVLALQGSIYPTTDQVLWVDSPAELYWKARTYGTYNGKGWLSENTVTEPLGYTPEFSLGAVDRQRIDITYTVTPLYASKKLFSGDQVLEVDREVMIETQAPPEFTIDLEGMQRGQVLPYYLQEAGDALSQALSDGGIAVSDQDLAQSLPLQFRLDKVDRENGRVLQVQITEALPAIPEILSVSSPRGKFKIGNPYEVTSAVSTATPVQLRAAGTEYPAWVSERYTQLPSDLPQRVLNLASDVAGGEETPYAKAKAVEQYLRNNFAYNLRVQPPPYNADGVDHFLFTLGEGYSEYFSSSMAAMLRTEGVPARLAVGYTTGDRVGEEDLFAVTDSHNHAWVEVYFPDFGWIPFEPTPGETLPAVYQPGSERQFSLAGEPVDTELLDEDCFPELELDECTQENPSLEGFPINPNSNGGNTFVRLLPWLAGVLVGSLVIGGTIRWFWKRFMAVPGTPGLVFQRMTTLAFLAAAGPANFQTPYQFGHRLQQVLPAQEAQVSIIVDAYVRNRYGNKTPTDSERRTLAGAWVRLRSPMLWAVIRRRVQ